MKNHKQLLASISKAKKYIKTTKAMKSLFKENKLDVDIIDNIPICFAKIDTNAKTDGGIIYLSYKLLDNFEDNYSYIAHEITHFIQQCFGTKPTTSGDEHYLDNSFEIEGFQKQVEFINDEFGEEKAEEYTDNLLDYHEYKPKLKEKKKDELMVLTQE